MIFSFPSIEIEEPNTRIRKAWGFDGKTRAARERAVSQAPGGRAQEERPPPLASTCAAVMLRVLLNGRLNHRSEYPLVEAPRISGCAGRARIA